MTHFVQKRTLATTIAMVLWASAFSANIYSTPDNNGIAMPTGRQDVLTPQEKAVLATHPQAPDNIDKAHPYLFANSDDFDRLSRSNDETVSRLRKLVIAYADTLLRRGALPVPATGSNLVYLRRVEANLVSWAGAYRLTKQKKYLTAVRKQMKVLYNLNEWGRYHFLDIGEACCAVGIVYDWLYNELSASERRTIENNILSKCFVPYDEVTEAPDSWLKGDFNWNQVCHGGLTVGALAIYNSYPKECRNVVEHAAMFMPYATATYYPDGAYPEGPSYWGYGTVYQVITIEAMRSALGHCYGLDSYPGFIKSADFKKQLCGTTGLDYGYSDVHQGDYNNPTIHVPANRGESNEPEMLWFANETQRKDLQMYEQERIDILNDKPQELSRLSIFDLLWWKEIPENTTTAKPNLQASLFRGHMPLTIMTTDKAHNNAYVGFKGGTANHSHGHMDSGSFIYESQGVRWAHDLGSESYDKMRSAKLDLWNYEQNSSRWTTFRTSSDAHNLLRIDGAPLITRGIASDMNCTVDSISASATLITTSLYDAGKADKVCRTIKLSPDGDLVVADRVDATQDITLTSQWLTMADVTVNGHSALLKIGEKELVITAPDVDVIEVDDVSSIPGIQNSPNPDAKRIRFIKRIKAGDSSVLSITAKNL